ncbi:MAG: acetyltransferase [Chitinophagia bacterium]|nr:acetyltransferase [Chitinophagia bacterium]
MLLYGASGHGKVICSVLEQIAEPIMGFFDDNLSIVDLNGYKTLGSYDANLFSEEAVIITIGDNKVRKLIVQKVRHTFGKCISPSCYCDNLVSVGDGSVILQGSVIQRDTIIGKHVIVNTASSIDHDCTIGDYVHISPGATICGSVQIEEGTHIGAGASVIQNIKIGKWCVVGAGAVIINDIPDYSVVVGNPGRIIKNRNEIK